MAYDAIVCGAGPAGTTVASLLRGRRVAVFDSNPFYRPCGELVLLTEAKALGADVTHRAGAVEVRTRYGRREFKVETAMIDKAGWLRRRLAESGAELISKAARHPVVRGGTCYGVRADREYTASATYDCTGPARALVSHLTGASLREYASCYEETVATDGFDVPLVVYDPQVIPGGYGWVFPRGDGTAYLGLLAWPWAGALKERLAHLGRDLGLGDARRIERKGSKMFLGYARDVPVRNLLVAGEANGSCDPYTGSGIMQAVMDAEKCVRGGRRRSGFLRKASATVLRDMHPAFLQALEAVPLPFVAYYP
ncbi:MAG: NAD(P)/FAD-dependent oxidoreductase [Nitrososphaerota archaeon]|nr:NAD(P)/FAD-dependent oxidoreductase [Nitrososphaerota archaeon]